MRNEVFAALALGFIVGLFVQTLAIYLIEPPHHAYAKCRKVASVEACLRFSGLEK